MALAVIFYSGVANLINLGITVVLAVIEVVAFVHCLTQRADAFPVVGSLSKNAWAGILGAAALVTIGCLAVGYTGISIFAFAAITAAAIYLLDVRPALRDATEGSGGW